MSESQRFEASVYGAFQAIEKRKIPDGHERVFVEDGQGGGGWEILPTEEAETVRKEQAEREAALMRALYPNPRIDWPRKG